MRAPSARLQRANRPGGFVAASFNGFRFNKYAHIIGVVVNETTSETRIAIDIVTENSRKKRPMMPPINSIGMNTAISDRLIDNTVNDTSRAPLSAASKGERPFSRCRDTFSRTTIASSTTNPVAMVSAISDRLSML